MQLFFLLIFLNTLSTTVAAIGVAGSYPADCGFEGGGGWSTRRVPPNSDEHLPAPLQYYPHNAQLSHDKRLSSSSKEKRSKSSGLKNQSGAADSAELHSDKTVAAKRASSDKTSSGQKATKGSGRSLRGKQMPASKRKAEESTIVPPEQLSLVDPATNSDTRHFEPLASLGFVFSNKPSSRKRSQTSKSDLQKSRRLRSTTATSVTGDTSCAPPVSQLSQATDLLASLSQVFAQLQSSQSQPSVPAAASAMLNTVSDKASLAASNVDLYDAYQNYSPGSQDEYQIISSQDEDDSELGPSLAEQHREMMHFLSSYVPEVMPEDATVPKTSTKGSIVRSDGSASKVDGQENADPKTLVSEMGKSGSKTGSGKKKKRKGKNKLSRSEKAFEKLEKATEKLQQNKTVYHSLVNTLDNWIQQHASKAMELFKTFDIEGEGLITYEEFKSGMFDLNAPVSHVELHLLSKLLDPENSGEIDYTELHKGLQYAKEVIELEKDTEAEELSLILTERNVPRCKHCKLGIWGPYEEKNPVYVLLDLKLLSFESFKEHPGHFSVMVHSHIPVIGLIDLIKEKTGIVTSKMTIFKDRSRTKEALLPLDSTLEECDIEGEGEEDEPERVTLFYDYTTDVNDCPLLLCDHYFSDQARKK